MAQSQVETHTAAVVASVRAKLGRRATWPKFPGGYPGDIESALIDAVFSSRYAYDTTYGRGLGPKMALWRQGRVRGTNDPSLGALIRDIAANGPASWATAHFTMHISGRGKSKRLKAEVVFEAAHALRWQGFDVAADVTPARLYEFFDILQAVAGIGLPTARYMSMLLGFKEVKPDRMIHRFIHSSTGEWVGHAKAIVIARITTRSSGEGRSRDERKISANAALRRLTG
ncbi:MAG: hypothetical protein ACLPQS_16050 [Acidimicrobiales bacterium]